MIDTLDDNHVAAIFGLFGGIALGGAASIGRFCTLGAIEDALYGHDCDRLRMWAFALSIAIFGLFSLEYLGQVDYQSSMYFRQSWNPIASVVGGLMFGWGMATAGNCGYGALTRFAMGDLRGFVVVLVMSVSAYMAIGGPTGALREWAFPVYEHDSDAIPQGVAHLLGQFIHTPTIIPAFLIASMLAGWALSGEKFRRSFKHIFWSIVVGFAVISGWWATSWVSMTGFGTEAPISHSFAAPMGDTLLYAMTWTGGSISFGVGSVIGVVIGAFIGAMSRSRFRWEACDDPRELGRQIFGAFLMGTGGVIALGCSMGQGISAFATLTYSAPVVLCSIFVGAALGLRYLIHGFHLFR